MSNELNRTRTHNNSWIYQLPSQLACFLLAVCLVTAQINPCDATSVALGSSLSFISLAMGIGFLVALDSLLTPCEQGTGKQIQWLRLAFAIFGIWLWLCTTFVPGRGNARFAYNGCWQWISEGILALSIARLCSRLRIAASLIALMLGCAAGTVAYASYQYFIGMPAFRERFASDPDFLLREIGAVAGTSEAMQLANRLASLEPTGPFALTNSLAGLMAVWLVFLVVLFGSQAAANFDLSRVRRVTWTVRSNTWLSLLLGAGLIASFFVTLLLTKSRSAWLATIFGLLVACFFHPTLRQSGWDFAKRFRQSLALIATLCLVVVGGILVRDPMILTESGKSLSYRFDYWRGAVTLIQEEPWMGYGVANFQQNYNRVKVITASESPAEPHNFVLETACAGGLPLLATLSAILVILLLKMRELSRLRPENAASPFGSKTHSIDADRWAILSGGIGSCIGIVFFGLFFSDDDSLTSSILFVCVAGWVFCLIERLQWEVNDEQIAVACLISASVMFFHLLASGGWMQPGVMNSICVLVGLSFGLPSLQFENCRQTAGRCHWLVPLAGLLFVMMASADFVKTMCLPVLGSAEIVSSVSNNPTGIREPSEWLEIIKMDPFDLDLPVLAANQCVEVLRRGDLSSSTRQKVVDVFDACCQECLKRDPNQWIPNAECGKWNAILADSELMRDGEKASAIARKELAYGYFSKAAELYPNSAQTQLQAAVGATWCGKNSAAKRYMNQVEKIDRETPHTDRKLSAVVVYFPMHLAVTTAPLENQAQVEKQPGYAKGEPTMRWLRTNVP